MTVHILIYCCPVPESWRRLRIEAQLHREPEGCHRAAGSGVPVLREDEDLPVTPRPSGGVDLARSPGGPMLYDGTVSIFGALVRVEVISTMVEVILVFVTTIVEVIPDAIAAVVGIDHSGHGVDV